MDVDASSVNIQISDVFSTSDDHPEDAHTAQEALDEDFTHTIIVVEENPDDEANEVECDDLFEESFYYEVPENEHNSSLEGDIRETESDEIVCDQSNLNGSNKDDLQTDDDGDEYIIVEVPIDDEEKGKDCLEDVESRAQTSPTNIVKEINLTDSDGEKNSDSDCILISDDEDIPIKKPTKTVKRRYVLNKPPQVTEETILKEFYFEDEDISIIDEQKLEGPKKTLVRRTTEGFRCPLYCTFITKELSVMISHLINHKRSVITNTDESEGTYECPMCPFVTYLHSTFVKHISCHRKKNYGLVCSKCSYSASGQADLKKHVTAQHALYHHCENCSFKTKRKDSLSKHEIRCRRRKIWQKEEEAFKCHFKPCPFTTNKKENLKTHEWIQHKVGSSKIRNYKCPLDGCFFETFRKKLFEEHMPTHSGEELLCQLCNLRTNDFKEFREHILTHVSVP